MSIRVEINLYELVNLSVGHLLVVFHQLAYGAVVNVVAHAELSINLVTVGYGYVVHLVAESQDEHVLSISPSSCNT